MTSPGFVSATYATPVGDLAVIVVRAVDDEPAAIVAAGFCTANDLLERLRARGWPNDLEDRPDASLGPDFAEIDAGISAYLSGDTTVLHSLRVVQKGTALQQKVWDELRAIPAGATRTYTELAASAGKPKAMRAVGSACGANLVAPFVPCHRALRSDGTLGGYYYGLEAKRWLLSLEGATLL